MTSLFMGNVLFGSNVPADEAVVRNTAVPVEHDAPAAMQTDMPEMQEVETDPNPHLGLDPRQMASKWTEGSRAEQPIGIVSEQNVSNQMVNAQVSTSGTAADREASGITHKNLSYAVGIEPVGDLRDGGKMGNEYFEGNKKPIQDTANPSMSLPPGLDRDTIGGVAQLGRTNARDASMASLYSALSDGWQ
jgi:hypothetical protein